MKAPSVDPMTAIQVLSEAVGVPDAEAGEVRGDVAAGLIEEALEASAVMVSPSTLAGPRVALRSGG